MVPKVRVPGDVEMLLTQIELANVLEPGRIGIEDHVYSRLVVAARAARCAKGRVA
jgi:hypothetical protein